MTVPADDGTLLHVGVTGSGPGVVVLSGGPGCVHYLEDDALAPRGMRAWYPEPRGVGRSDGGPHDLARAVADIEAVRRAAGVDNWVVLGHSWGSDLAVRYALDHPGRVDPWSGSQDTDYTKIAPGPRHTSPRNTWRPTSGSAGNQPFTPP